MRRHERDEAVDEAEVEIAKALAAVRKRYHLTRYEYLGILTREMQQVLKYALRAERNPDDLH